MKLVFFLAGVIPLSLSFWLVNLLLFGRSQESEWVQPITPMRCLLSIIIPVYIAKWGLSRKSLDTTGALAGLLVGFTMTISSYCFFASLLVFFILGSKVTKFRSHMKRSVEEDFKEGGQRNWVQVLCNGGVATQLAILYMMETGSGEQPVDFYHSYNASWLAMAMLGALACACGDTFASEIGTVVGSSDPWLITTFKKVPKGTNGGISVMGTLASVLGGVMVGAAYYVALVMSCSMEVLHSCPPQIIIIAVGGLAGLIGSVIDSVLGATLQYSGFNKAKNCVVETPGPDVIDISGTPMLDNHSVNLVASLITALITPYLAFSLWQPLVS